MPYVDEDDPKLPKDVREMSADERRAFVNTFNGVLEKCESDDGKDCEGRAMAMARSAVEMMNQKLNPNRDESGRFAPGDGGDEGDSGGGSTREKQAQQDLEVAQGREKEARRKLALYDGSDDREAGRLANEYETARTEREQAQARLEQLQRPRQQSLGGTYRTLPDGGVEWVPDEKVGRRISAATRETLQKAVDALLSLLAADDATDADRQAAQEALEELFHGEDAGPMMEMMAHPDMMVKVMKAELDRRQDGMIAFFLPKGVADELALPNDETVGYKAEPADQLHITLCYFPDINALGYEANRETLVAELTKFAKEMAPIMGRLSGVGRFNNADADAFYVSFDGTNLPGFRQWLVDCLSKAGIWNVSGEHGFSPHITLAYVPADAPDPVMIDWVTAVRNRELKFDTLSLVLGNDRTDFELTGWNYKADRKELQDARDKRAERYGIEPKEGGALTPPKDFPQNEKQYGDPVNYRYPIDAGHVRAALSYFNQSDNQKKGGYSEAEWKVIGKRIAEAAGELFETPYEFADGVVRKKEEAKKSDAEILFDIEASCGRKAIKVVNTNARRIAAYATVWGEVDCDNERMTREAIEPYLGKGVPYMFWMHGLDREFGANVVGVWDAKSFKVDDFGLYVEGNISRDKWGNKAWEEIESTNSYGLSVGSHWFLVKRKQLSDGTVQLIDWPLLDISVMKGGKQCVPSAQRKLDAEIEPYYRKAAAKLNLVWREPEQAFIKIGDRDMDKEEFETAVAAKVTEALAAKEAAEKAEQEKEARIAAKAAEMAAAGRAEWEKELREKWEKEEAGRKDGQATKRQPRAPSTGVPINDLKSIQVFSPYDRLDTFDLCLRYEVMRSYGKQPSEKFWRVLAARAVKMSQDEDVIRVEHGREVKVPALDWAAVMPKNVDLSEVDGDVMGVKAGQFDTWVRGGIDASQDVVTPKGVKQLAYLALKANEVVYSTQANAGDEWVPTLMSAQLWRTVRLNAAVLGLFQQFDMPSNPYDYPTESTDPTFYKVAETTDETQLVLSGGPFTDSKIGTAKIAFSAGKLGAIGYWTEEMQEDSIIAFEPQIGDQYGVKAAHTIDEVLISGDEATGTGNISFDGSAIAATSRFLTVDGLRDQALAVTATDSRDGGTLSLEDFGATQALMGVAGKFGVNPTDQAFIVDPAAWHKAKLLPEVLTIDKFGAAATILTGQLGSLFGVPLVVSEDYGLTDTAGKISATGGNNTKGSFLCVNKRGVLVGWRRRPRVRIVGLPGADARYIVTSARLDIGFREAGMVGLTYNLTV